MISNSTNHSKLFISESSLITDIKMIEVKIFYSINLLTSLNLVHVLFVTHFFLHKTVLNIGILYPIRTLTLLNNYNFLKKTKNILLCHYDFKQP